MIKFWRTTGEFGCFSNFSNHPFEVDGVRYKTSEHFYQAAKAINDKDRQKILSAKTPKECKKIANSIERRDDWENVKFDIMLKALRAKVASYEFMGPKLLATGNEEIAEDSPYDAEWGLGKDGKGKNLLGKAWMEIRNELKNE